MSSISSQRLLLRLWALILSALMTLATASAQTKMQTGFYFPTDTVLTSNLNWMFAGSHYFSGEYHTGSDIKATYRDNVYAVGPGKVVFVYTTISDVWQKFMWVQYELEGGGSFYAVYGHVNATKRVGDTVTGGDVIATIATWDGSSIPHNEHCHFGIRPEGIVTTVQDKGKATEWGWGRAGLPSNYNGDPNTLDRHGFVAPYDYLMSHRPPGAGSAPVVSWTHHYDPTQPKWFKALGNLSGDHPNSFTFSITGSDTLNVWEYVDGVHPPDQPHHNHSGWIELDRGGVVGWHTYRVRAENSLGSSDIQLDAGFDNLPPTAVRTAGPAPSTWVRSAGQAVQYTVSDVGSGPKQSHWWYEGQGDSGWSGENPRGCPLPNADGKYKLYVEAEDNAWDGSGQNGNSAVSLIGEYWVDNTAPNVHIVSVTPPSPGDASQVSIVVDGDDPGYPDTGSGLASGVVTVDGVVIPDVGGSHLWDASNAADGPHTIVATVTDGAGNTASATTTYTIDRTPATAAIAFGPTAPDGANGWYVTAPTVTLSATGGTGTPSLRYRINGGAEATYSAPFTFTQRGVVTIEYWAVSSAGKKGNVGTATVWVDTTKPVGFTLEDEGAKTPSVSALNVSLRGVIDGESGYLKFKYEVGNAAGDDRYGTGTMPARGPWLTLDGLFLPPNVPVVVTLSVQNGAGVWSDWFATDGITVDPAAWEHAVWNMVIGAAGGPSTASDGAHDGTLGEPIVGQSLVDNGLLRGGFWSLFDAPKLGGTISLSDYKSTGTPVPLKIELRLPGTTTVVETHTVTMGATGTLSIALGRTGNFDIAIKANHWLRVVKKNVVVTPFGGDLGAISLLNGDVNGDNRITLVDYTLLKNAFGSAPGQTTWNPLADLNGDGHVTLLDYSILQRNFQKQGDP
jgi:hypothetical protein